jgi:hypothetical protein
MKYFLPLLILLSFHQSIAASHKAIMAIPIHDPSAVSVMELIELMISALKDVGIDVTTQIIPPIRSLEMTGKGEIDFTLNDDLVGEVDRKNLLSTSFPYLYARARVFSRKNDSTFKIEQLEKYKGAVTLNSSGIIHKAKELKLQYTETKSVEQNLQLLHAKRVDYVIAMESLGINAAKKVGLTDEITMHKKMFALIPMYFTMNKKYEAKLPEIEKALRHRIHKDANKYPAIKEALNKK